MNRLVAFAELFCVGSVLMVSPTLVSAEDGTVDFAVDPGWEAFRNRLLPEPVPVTRQDFGWRGLRGNGARNAGEVGGWVQRAVRPATYAKVIPTRTLNDRLSASGTFYVTEDRGGSGTMFGWFHESSRGWRSPNSLVFRIDGNGRKYWVFYEYGTRGWLTGGGGCFEGERYQTTRTKPFRADGTPHEWALTYDPDGAAGNGLVTFVLDGTAYTQPLAPGHKVDGAEFNRFGIVNQQLTGDGMQVYFRDLTMDGEAMELRADPGWMGVGNRVEYADRARRPFHDFGWMATNRAGGKVPGEIGGMIWRDVQPAYYAAQTGKLTLEDALRASGTIAFLGAGSDSGMYLGWFSAETKKDPSVKEQENPKNIVAILIEGPSRAGHYFRPEARTRTGEGVAAQVGPVIRPDGTVHRWELRYSPVAADGSGQVTVTFDGKEQTVILTPEQRRIGATLDRFGIFNCQTGGHYVEIAVGELKFTKR